MPSAPGEVLCVIRAIKSGAPNNAQANTSCAVSRAGASHAHCPLRSAPCAPSLVKKEYELLNLPLAVDVDVYVDVGVVVTAGA